MQQILFAVLTLRDTCAVPTTYTCRQEEVGLKAALPGRRRRLVGGEGRVTVALNDPGRDDRTSEPEGWRSTVKDWPSPFPRVFRSMPLHRGL